MCESINPGIAIRPCKLITLVVAGEMSEDTPSFEPTKVIVPLETAKAWTFRDDASKVYIDPFKKTVSAERASVTDTPITRSVMAARR